jgi:hypothetical protein
MSAFLSFMLDWVGISLFDCAPEKGRSSAIYRFAAVRDRLSRKPATMVGLTAFASFVIGSSS